MGGTAIKVFLVAGEHSGDALGAKLMSGLKSRSARPLEFSGVGGSEMTVEGLSSLFAIEDVAVMGPLSILPRLPKIVRRVYQTVDAAVVGRPDIVVIIDSPEFTHPIAKRIRKRMPQVPIVDYVCPSVWAWRPWRARKMRPYIDHVLALLPFEPDALKRLGGPESTYVGHPLIERLDEIHAADGSALAKRIGLDGSKPVLLVLPGSRRSEVDRLIDVFGQAVAKLKAGGLDLDVIIPAVAHVRPFVESRTAQWSVRPHIVESADKYAAMRLATAALAASGTVTLELALAGTPTVVAYRVDKLIAQLRFLVKVESVVLANLVIGERVYPEYLQEACTPENLAAALLPLLGDTQARRLQVHGLRLAADKLKLAQGDPSTAAADTVLRILEDHAAGKSRLAGPM